MRGVNLYENIIGQDILENLVSAAEHYGSGESAIGDFIAADRKVLASTEIANSTYSSESGIICKTQLETKKYLEQN